MKNSPIKVTGAHNKPSKRGLLLLILLSICFVRMNSNQREMEKGPGPGHTASAGLEQDNKVVIAWNELAYTIANEHDQFLSFIGIRALTMTHLAMHDVLNAIRPVYEQYAFKEKAPGVDALAASSQAAYKVLSAIYPQKEQVLKAENQKWFALVANEKLKEAAIQLGDKSAASVLELRKEDGHLSKGNYKPQNKPGSYRYTPGFDWVWMPDLKKVIPFGLKSSSQFRAGPPPALSSALYAESFNEVKEFGRVKSNKRSPDQTSYAHWWAEFAEHSWNRICRITATERKLPLWEAARMFALINMDIFDIYISSFDSKYFYDTWRPITAIHSADSDNNPATQADTTWRPEMVTPPWPEYPSAHAAVTAGGAEILGSVYSTSKIRFSMESLTALPDSKHRTYANLNEAVDDCASSRIMNGYHFRFATDAGVKQGREIARYIYANQLRPFAASTVNK